MESDPIDFFVFNQALSNQGNRKENLIPDSIEAASFEVKIGILSFKIAPATIETNMNNPFNDNVVLSRNISFDIIGFGYSETSYSYNHGQTWLGTNIDYTPSWSIDRESGGMSYNGAFGFKVGKTKLMYQFEIKGVINGAQ